MLSIETDHDWHALDAKIAEYTQITPIYRAFALDDNEGLTCLAFDAKGSLHIFFEDRKKKEQAEEYKEHNNYQEKHIIHYTYEKKEIYACKKERIYSQQRVAKSNGAVPEYICYIIIHIQIRQKNAEKTHSINFGQEFHGNYADMIYTKLQNRMA